MTDDEAVGSDDNPFFSSFRCQFLPFYPHRAIYLTYGTARHLNVLDVARP